MVSGMIARVLWSNWLLPELKGSIIYALELSACCKIEPANESHEKIHRYFLLQTIFGITSDICFGVGDGGEGDGRVYSARDVLSGGLHFLQGKFFFAIVFRSHE